MSEVEAISTGEKTRSIIRMARYRPLFTAGIILFSTVTALLEGFGLSFIVPIVELLQGSDDLAGENRRRSPKFGLGYQALGLPFTLEFIIGGVAGVMILRYTASFSVAWLREILIVEYFATSRWRPLTKRSTRESRTSTPKAPTPYSTRSSRKRRIIPSLHVIQSI